MHKLLGTLRTATLAGTTFDPKGTYGELGEFRTGRLGDRVVGNFMFMPSSA